MTCFLFMVWTRPFALALCVALRDAHRIQPGSPGSQERGPAAGTDKWRGPIFAEKMGRQPFMVTAVGSRSLLPGVADIIGQPEERDGCLEVRQLVRLALCAERCILGVLTT